jgi:hypothetical protein
VNKLQDASNTMVRVNSVGRYSQQSLCMMLNPGQVQRTALAELWSLVASYQDAFITKVMPDTSSCMRSATALHLLNHVHKYAHSTL